MSGNIGCILSFLTTVLLGFCLLTHCSFFKMWALLTPVFSTVGSYWIISEHFQCTPLKLEIKGMDKVKRWACSGFYDCRKSLDGVVSAIAGSWNRASTGLLISGTRDLRLSYFSHSLLFTLCIYQSWGQLKLLHMAVEFTASFCCMSGQENK